MFADKISDATNEIALRVKAGWPYPTAIPNTAFDDAALAREQLWARLRIAYAGGQQSSLAGDRGQVRFERYGSIIVQTFGPLGRGTDIQQNAAETLIKELQRKTVSASVWFRDVGLVDIGSDGAWYQMNVQALFTFEQVQ